MELQQSIAQRMEEEGSGKKRESLWRGVKVLVKDKRLRVSRAVCWTMAVNYFTSGSMLLSSYSVGLEPGTEIQKSLRTDTP